jgi:hypothetical protein
MAVLFPGKWSPISGKLWKVAEVVRAETDGIARLSMDLPVVVISIEASVLISQHFFSGLSLMHPASSSLLYLGKRHTRVADPRGSGNFLPFVMTNLALSI